MFKVQPAQIDNVVKAKLAVPPKSCDEGEKPLSQANQNICFCISLSLSSLYWVQNPLK